MGDRSHAPPSDERVPFGETPVWVRVSPVAVFVVFLALVAVVDPPVSRWSIAIERVPAALGWRSLVDPLGRAPLYALVFLLCLVVAGIRRSRASARVAGLVALTLMAGTGVGHLIKVATARPRPAHLHETVPWGEALGNLELMLDGKYHSLPSGDVTIAAGVATLFWLLIGRGTARYLVYVVPLLSTSGRIVGARHYPSDCFAAFLVGIAVAVVLWRLWPASAAIEADG